MTIRLANCASERKAIVATNVGAVPELLDNGKAGILVHDANIDNLTAALCKVVEDTTIRERYGLLAKERAENIYGTEKTFKHLWRYYKLVIES